MSHSELSTQQSRVLALAAIVHASMASQSIAQTGVLRSALITICLDSLFAHESKQNMIIRYGGIENLQYGLTQLIKLLRGDEKFEDGKEIMMHTAGMIALERTLAKDQAMLQHLAAGMKRINKQKDYFNDVCHENVVAGLSGLYGETLSNLTPRIVVHGKQKFLHQSSHTDMIRAVLLSGIRAAHLWRTHGGSHMRLLLGRKKLIRDANDLLNRGA